jgi:hypothetical protein
MTIKKDHWRAMDNEYLYATLDFLRASILVAVLLKQDKNLLMVPSQKKLIDKVSTILLERAENA